MKKIETIIRPEMLGIVKSALEDIGLSGMTITRVEGRGRQKGIVQKYKGKEYHVDFLSKVKVEIFVDDREVEKAIDTIQEAAATGQVGDGKIIIVPLEDVIRIRTKERGSKAL